MIIREIEPGDVPAIFRVRTATDENRMSRRQLARAGITEQSVLERLQGTYRGWLAEEDGNVVGFAMGNCGTGELWVIAVLPTHIRQGLGSHLLRTVEEWMWHCGCGELWLETALETTTRAYQFYRNRGWVDSHIEGRVRFMKKRQPRITGDGAARTARRAGTTEPADGAAPAARRGKRNDRGARPGAARTPAGLRLPEEGVPVRLPQPGNGSREKRTRGVMRPAR